MCVRKDIHLLLAFDMSRLIIVSNRLPITIDKKHGELIYYPSAGGLATGLNSLDDSLDRLWVGWPGREIKDEDERHTVEADLAKDNLVPVFLTKKQKKLYYEGFSNKVIWPHFHYFTQYTTYEDEYWKAYEQVNRKFADAVIAQMQPDDMVWVHDYQLMLLPQMIREAHPESSIGFFLHIPFPSYEIFRVLPWREHIIHGLLGADQVGFHTFGYMRHFLSAAYRITGYENNFGKLVVGNRSVNVDVFPMGIDYDKYAYPKGKDVEEAERRGEAFRKRYLQPGQKLMLSIDRLDYTKGIPQRIRAFQTFLEKHPEWHGKVSLAMVVVPSRSAVDQYQELKNEVETLVGRIDGAFSTFDWSPIYYFYRSFSFDDLTAMYKAADVALITPIRDGMNLVAKEFVAAKEQSRNGVLILSEMAGASNELNEALTVNPMDQNSIVEAIATALEMPQAEQRRRILAMQEKLKRYTVELWAENFMNAQIEMTKDKERSKTRLLKGDHRKQLLEAYRNAERRLLFLDYDGTLMGFKTDPTAVVPDDELLQLLEQLKADPRNKVVIISGRDRSTLHDWLHHLALDMAAEHGVWVRRNGEWNASSGIAKEWKDNVRPVLQNLVERTPGSFIEEKDYSLAWHYRKIDKYLGQKRVREFRDVLSYLTSNLDLQVLEGNKVVEIKNAGVNKGKAALTWLQEAEYDFVLAIGDDHTDEDTFKALPKDTGYAIKVGRDQTVAPYNLMQVEEVRKLLEELTG